MEYSETVHRLFIDFKKAYDSFYEGSNVQYSYRVCGMHETR
jgi:hypothetical protein